MAEPQLKKPIYRVTRLETEAGNVNAVTVFKRKKKKKKVVSGGCGMKNMCPCFSGGSYCMKKNVQLPVLKSSARNGAERSCR